MKGCYAHVWKKHRDNGEKIYRYSIRKYHFGAASVAVAALMFFANGAVAASETITPTTASDVVKADSDSNADGNPESSDEGDSKKALTDQPVELKSADEPKGQEAPVEESDSVQAAAESKMTGVESNSAQPETNPAPQEAPQAEGEGKQDQSAPVANRTAAESIQSTLEALLANLTLDSMKALHTEVEEGHAKAKAVLENPKATEAQVDEQVKLMEDLTRRVREACLLRFFFFFLNSSSKTTYKNK
ncbi:YSIRK-type signal peptide-containing protein [Streptococcus pneumoniae]|nr:YSIRK-type signal peptide-containing protein [Streptococcus pneumoniae]